MKRNSKSKGVESYTVEIKGGKHFSAKLQGIRVLQGISMIITTYKIKITNRTWSYQSKQLIGILEKEIILYNSK